MPARAASAFENNQGLWRREHRAPGTRQALLPRHHHPCTLNLTYTLLSRRRYMAALLQPYNASGLDPAWLEPAPQKCRLGVELLSCSS